MKQWLISQLVGLAIAAGSLLPRRLRFAWDNAVTVPLDNLLVDEWAEMLK